jgi:hypothetical protein
MNRALNLGVIFAIHVCFLGDHSELFELVIRERHGNRDVRRIATSSDNDSADSRLIVPGIKAKPATA